MKLVFMAFFLRTIFIFSIAIIAFQKFVIKILKEFKSFWSFDFMQETFYSIVTELSFRS